MRKSGILVISTSVRERDRDTCCPLAPICLFSAKHSGNRTIQRSCEFEESVVLSLSLFVVSLFTSRLIESREDRRTKDARCYFLADEKRGRAHRNRGTRFRRFRRFRLHDLVEIMQRHGIERTCGISNGRRSEFRIHLYSSVSLCRSGPPSNIRILMTC